MLNYKEKKKSITYIQIICFLLLISLLYCINFNNTIRLVAYAASILICVLTLLNGLKNGIKADKLFIYTLFFVLYNIFLLFIDFSSNALYVVAQELILILFACFFSNFYIDENKFVELSKFMANLYKLFLICSVIIICLGVQSVIKSSISITVYKAFFALSYFAFIRTNKKTVLSIISAVIFFGIGERTTAIIFLAIIFFYAIIKKIKTRKQFNLVLIFIIAALLIFVFVYVELPKTKLGIRINEISRNLSGENFFSGRNVIWDQVLSSIGNNKLFGLGYNNKIELTYGGNLSTHNLYLWLMLNGGYVLLILFIILIIIIWNKYYGTLNKNRVALSAVYMISFLILCNFELLLLTNNFVVSLIMWLVISLGINCKVKN